jgi:hypothetical protein
VIPDRRPAQLKWHRQFRDIEQARRLRRRGGGQQPQHHIERGWVSRWAANRGQQYSVPAIRLTATLRFG